MLAKGVSLEDIERYPQANTIEELHNLIDLAKYEAALKDACIKCKAAVSEVLVFDESGPRCMVNFLHSLVREAESRKEEFEELLVSDAYGKGEAHNEIRVKYARGCRAFTCSFDICIKPYLENGREWYQNWLDRKDRKVFK